MRCFTRLILVPLVILTFVHSSAFAEFKVPLSFDVQPSKQGIQTDKPITLIIRLTQKLPQLKTVEFALGTEKLLIKQDAFVSTSDVQGPPAPVKVTRKKLPARLPIIVKQNGFYVATITADLEYNDATHVTLKRRIGILAENGKVYISNAPQLKEVGALMIALQQKLIKNEREFTRRAAIINDKFPEKAQRYETAYKAWLQSHGLVYLPAPPSAVVSKP